MHSDTTEVVNKIQVIYTYPTLVRTITRKRKVSTFNQPPSQIPCYRAYGIRHPGTTAMLPRCGISKQSSACCRSSLYARGAETMISKSMSVLLHTREMTVLV